MAVKQDVVAVDVRNLSKNYPLSGSQWARFRRLFATHPDLSDGLWALRDVSFTVARGEAFGIIGANGSGKSTLLQIVSGILRPTAGSIEVKGRLSALLELGSGFSPEFTGRDNVYLNGSLLGLSREEIDERFPVIERFAEIGAFIDQPIKTYSTGMVLRLAFAVTAHVDPEILIVDEALAVGDIAFRQRCMRRIHDLRARGTTILFVSHDATDVKALCERCLWLENGVAQMIGEADEVVARYMAATLHREITHRSEIAGAPDAAPESEAASDILPRLESGHRFGDGRARLAGAALLTATGSPVEVATPGERVVLKVRFEVKHAVSSLIAGFLVRNGKGENIFGSNTARENYPMPRMAEGDAHTVDFHWTTPEIAPGQYRISLAVADGNIEEYSMCDYAEDAIRLAIVRDAGDEGTHAVGYFRVRCAEVVVHRE